MDFYTVIDTDVNGACLGEVRHGAGKNKESVVYGTIGTGIGFGIYKIPFLRVLTINL